MSPSSAGWSADPACVQPPVAVCTSTPGWTYAGDGDYGGLLAAEDLTAEAAELEGEVPRWVAEARRVLAEDDPDRCRWASQSTDPYDCPFQGYCERGLETVEFPVNLPAESAAARRWRQLIEEGYVDLREWPSGRIDHPL